MTIIIGIDPHKATHTAVAIDEAEQPLAQFQLAADHCQAMRLLAWAAPFEGRAWAVESADGLGKLLAQQLVVEGNTSSTSRQRWHRESGCWDRRRHRRTTQRCAVHGDRRATELRVAPSGRR